MGKELLHVKDLSLAIYFKHRRLELLKKINFILHKAETLALVGESGSGKSLTALSIMQLLPEGAVIESNSHIYLENEDLLAFSELKMRSIRGRKIAIIFQEAISALNPVLTIGEQIKEVLKCHFDMSRNEIYIRTLSLLEEVGIPNQDYYFNAYPHQLSGGLKQRAMIAIALAGEPSLLIADEPTTSLDVTLQAQIIELLKNLQKKRGMGLIFITHDLGIVYEVADQVIVLRKGEIVESASTKVFFSKPTHPYSQKLFASLPGWLQPPSRPALKEAGNLLEVKDLRVFFPIKKGILQRTVGFVKAVDGVSFELNKGKTLALVGESGSGKTTTGMAILRLVNITAGQIYLDDLDLAKLSSSELRKYRKNFQVVFQDPFGSMDPRMRVSEIIAEGFGEQKLLLADKKNQVKTLLESVGLDPEVMHRYPHEFSGGQRQRICIARAIAMKPKLLICDEPTSALDVAAQMQILELLNQLQNELGLSYLLITHNIAVVAYMADMIAVMHKGQIVELGPVDKILNYPSHPYTIKLLTAVPKVPRES